MGLEEDKKLTEAIDEILRKGLKKYFGEKYVNNLTITFWDSVVGSIGRSWENMKVVIVV